MKSLIQILSLALISIFFNACIKAPEIIQEDENAFMNTSFDFKMNEEIQIDINIKGNNSSDFSGMKMELIDNESNEVLFTAFTNSSGKYFGTTHLASFKENLRFRLYCMGIPNDWVLKDIEDGIQIVYSNGQLNTNMTQYRQEIDNSKRLNTNNTLNFNYLGTYNNSGVPDYLEPVRDQISASLLQYINASLPESQPVPQYHPTYLADGKKTVLDIVDTSDVWITFVHEGAGFRNAIGFYTYPSNQTPQSLNEISTINVVFPNLSFQGSGGGLISGDKINIGRFSPGTSIGLVLLADGWNGNNSENYRHMVYADKQLNPESDPNFKQHNVLLWDDENELFILGFEDLLRADVPYACDNDFNDAILFITSNPVTGISKVNVNPIDKPGTLDSDGDGINDIFDEFPSDPTKAYQSYYPSSSTYGTFAFEDNWPNFGDYDFNDAVIDYQFNQILNASNEVISMNSRFKIRALGAGYRNGFGFSSDLLPSDVQSVTSSGQNIFENYIQLNSNGTESNQDKAVFIVCDNLHGLFSGSGFINTVMGYNYENPVEIALDIVFNAPKTTSEIGTLPLNPFLIVSGNRGREIHLPSYKPTDLVDASLFGTLDDNSDLLNSEYYKSKTDLPWAIHLPESFDYPKEKSDVRNGYLRFNDWAQSSGFSYMDWFRNQGGYRSSNHIYRNN